MSREVAADLVVRLSAEQATFDRDVKKAQATLKTYTGSAKNAQAANDALAGGFSRAANGASVLYGPLNGVSGRLSSMSSMLTKVNLGWIAVGAGVSAAIAGMSYGVSTFAETEARLLKQEQLLRATGYASGYTAEQLDVMARSIARNTLASTAGVASAQSIMLTFKSITGDTFESAIKLSQDMAAVMGTDIKSAAMQLGKALESPTEGLSALKRSGVSFSASQKDLIKDLEETGNVAEAQRIVLKTLSDQLGGAGEAEAQGMTGIVDTLGQEWQEFWEHLADRSGAAETTKSALSGLVKVLDEMDKRLFPDQDDLLTRLSKERNNLTMTMDYRLSGRDPASLPKNMGVNYVYDQRQYNQDKSRLDEIDAQIKQINADQEKARAAEAAAAEKAAEAEKTRAEEAAAEREKKQKEKAEKEAARQAKLDKAAQARADKEKKREAERQARELKSQQNAGANTAFGLDKTYGDEVSDLKLEHSRRLDEIQSMVLSEEEIRRRGFESLAQLRKAYANKEKEFYQTKDAEYRQSLVDKISSEVELQSQSQQSQQEAAREKYDKTQTLIQDYFDKGILTEQQKIALSTKNLTKYQATVDKIQRASMQNVLTFSSQQMGVMTDMLSDAGKEHTAIYKMLFAAQKAAAIPSMIVSTEQAAVEALAAFPGPAGLVMSNVIRGLGYASIGVVTGQALAGMAHDGIDNVPTEGTWLLQKNERVIDSRTNGDLKEYLANENSRNTSGNVIVNLIEDASRAGSVEQSSEDDITTLDIKVAKIMQSSSSQTSQVMKTRYRTQQYGS